VKNAIIVGNGYLPRKSEINKLLSLGFDFLIAADGGANSTRKIGILPNLIIGDFDSISNENLEYYQKMGIKTEQLKRQNDTDIEKAIKYLISKKVSKAIIFGGSGDRLDHTFGNIGNLLKYYEKIQLYLVHQKTIVNVLFGEISIKTQIGETISLYGLDEFTKISTIGLKYELKNQALPFGEKDGTSNLAIQNPIKISSNGKILLMRNFLTTLKSGYFA
jgi:thiamine pyrophosphokinase